MHIEEESEERTEGGATAQGYLKMVASTRFVSLLHFLSYLFVYLSRLSESFQNDNLVVSDIPSLVNAISRKIAKLRKRPRQGGNLQKFKEDFEESSSKFEGIKLS